MRSSLGSLVRSLAASATALRNGSIRRVTLAFLAYSTVEMAAWTAILVYAYGATGPASVGIIAVVQLVPSALAAPLLANIGDRLPRVTVLRGWLLVQGVALAGVGVAILAGAPPLVVYAASLAATITLTQTRPIHASLLPELAGEPDELTAANALTFIAGGFGGILGPVLAGVVLTFGDPALTFLTASLVVLGGSILLVGVRAVPDAPQAPQDDDAPRNESSDLLAGLREVARDADLAVVMALLASQFIIFGGLEVLLVILAIDVLGIGEAGAGYLLGALGLGSVLGGTASFALAGRRRLAPWLGIGAIIIAVPVALIGVAAEARAAAALLVVAGIGIAILDVTGQTLLQRITPDAVRSRVFGVLEGLLLVGEAVGSLIVVPVALVFGPQGAVVFLGLLLPVVAALAVVRFARIDARVAVPEVELRALRQVTLFAPLGAAPLESLARHLVRVPVHAGEVVIREGDVGDRWYLVDSGRYRVTRGAVHRDEIGPGEAFGEIALLRNVPRTATVTAMEDGVLWALDREEFLAAVTGSPQALMEAERTATARLR